MRTPLALVIALTACSPVSADADGDTVDADDTPDTDTDTPPQPSGPAPALTSDGVVACDPSEAAARVSDGPYRLLDGGPGWDAQPVDPEHPSLFVGGGVTVADLDGDGRLDVALPARDDRFALLLQTSPLQFTDGSARLPPVPERTGGAVPIDLDADGDLDLHITVWRGPDLLLRNDGDRFVDIATTVGFGASESRVVGAAWADHDRDGDLDAFVGGYGATGAPLPDGDPSHLWIQGSDGTFTDRIAPLGDSHPLKRAHTFGGRWTDADGDGDLDLFMVNDFGWRYPTLLLSNDGAGELLRDELVGVEVVAENMGLGAGDVNGDLVPDFLVAAWDKVALLVSSEGTWYDEAAATGLALADTQHVAWGADLVDVDNDGDLDASVAMGFLNVQSNNVNPRVQPDALWVREGAAWTDMAPAWGLDDGGRARGFVWVDIDRNGWLDLVTRDLRGPARIHLARCGEAAWLGVRLRQPGPNPDAIGARVLVRAEIGGAELTQWREITAGGLTYASAGPTEVHVGLGDATAATIEVRWPDGQVDVVPDVDARQWVTITRNPATAADD